MKSRYLQHLLTEPVREFLKKRQAEIWKLPAEFFSAEWKDEIGRDPTTGLHNARWWQICFELHDILDSEATSKCGKCGQEFEYFGRIDRSGVALDDAPPRCLDCERAHMRAEQRKAALLRFVDSNPGAKFYLTEVSSPPRPMQFNQAMQWLQVEGERQGNLVLFGPSWLGKTTCMYVILSEMAQAGYAIVIVMASDLSALSGMSQSARDESIAELATAEVLAIDDFCKSEFDASNVNSIYRILERRRQNRLPTLLTLNARYDLLLRAMSGKTEKQAVDAEAVANRLFRGATLIDFTAEHPAGATA